MSVALLSLATAVPPHVVIQRNAAAIMASILKLDAKAAAKLSQLYSNTAIDQRHVILPDFIQDREQWRFFDKDYPNVVPGMHKRNSIYKEHAPQLAYEAAYKALESWGGDPQTITHVISVSCTGVVAPGIEFDLIDALGLRADTHRLGINFMGCFGAFKGLSVAKSFASSNPSHRVLLVCTELCSLHFQADTDLEALTANAIFADGAAAAIVGAQPYAHEKPMWTLEHETSLALKNSKDKMSWEAGDTGFQMRLSAHVPVLFNRHINSFIDKLLCRDIDKGACDWAIHPGGTSILKAVEKSLRLDDSQTRASWQTLAQHGNMSSATFLFVLDNLYRQQTAKQWTLGLGFGPGLSMEGIVLRKSQ
jgi:predicted naringenin-chalcone synthase